MRSNVALIALHAALWVFLAISVKDAATTQHLFVHAAYYFSMLLVVCWAGTYLLAARRLRLETTRLWARENWPGVLIAVAITVIAAFAIEPALRVLSDEANLVGTSKNLFASKTATFTVSGKNYYGSTWDVDVAIDRRPILFPFMVSLVHAALGYSHENAFLFNLLLLPVFLLVAYRLAKSTGGETFAVVAALLVAAHPILLISVRSGGFDFFALLFALLAIKSLFDYARERSPTKLAILWMNLCMFAQIRYESALFIPPVLVLLLLLRMVSWRRLRPYAFIYALTPAYFLPRVWQAVLRGNVPEQEPGAITFSLQNFLANAHEYFQPLLSPSRAYPAHSAFVIALGVIGSLLWARWLIGGARAKQWKAPQLSLNFAPTTDGWAETEAESSADSGASERSDSRAIASTAAPKMPARTREIGPDRLGGAKFRLRFSSFVIVWMVVQAIIVFTYVWGRAQYPSAARLVMAIDTFFSFAAAWALTRIFERWRPFVTVLIATAILATTLPVASQARLMNRLTQTRESAVTWGFFERLHEKRILIVTDRPNHFTIMDYGAMSFEAARRDPYLFTAFDRHLFQDVYVIQPIKLSTKEPLPGYAIWPDRKLDVMLEFQNDADVLIRISRLAR